MTYQEATDFLFSQLPMYQRIGNSAYKANLNNIIQLCQALGNPQLKLKCIHVAGTNGKGSSSHMLASVLQHAGYKTGLYTSPHLKNFTERIRINGSEIDKSYVTAFVEQHQHLFSDIQPSFFEMTVALAFAYFADADVDIAVIEVGLGGRLDSTNIIQPVLSLITNISYDHQKLLGDTLEQIAFEKAGIIKQQTPAVISERQSIVEKVFIKQAEKNTAPLYFASDEIQAQPTASEGCYKIQSASDFNNWDICLDLLGSYQTKNLPGVLKSIMLLREAGYKISDQAVLKGLHSTVTTTGLKGRWQILNQSPLTICDTAHNEDGIRQVLKQLSKYEAAQVHFVFGTVNDKDLSKILGLLPKHYTYYFCQPAIPRAMPVDELINFAHKIGLKGQRCSSVREAIKNAQLHAKQNDVVFIGGSNFVVAEIENL